jgi:hypothetical protein
LTLQAVLGGAAVLACLLYGSGWALARVLGRHADLFARVWCGLAATSVAGLLLAQAGAFSLGRLIGALAALSVAAMLIGRLRGKGAAEHAEGARAPERLAAPLRTVRALACAAGLSAIVWSWPPFETVIAASDSTMYVNAGIHLARTGSLVVTDSVTRLLGPFVAGAVFPSVRWGGLGPFIRLPGGLLMADLASGKATPAFFPLTSVWAAIPAAAGGPEAAPLAAPLFAGLAVWSVVLFAGETFGVVAAAATTVLVLANFAFWWFGRFLVSEPLACAFFWGGLVFLGRHIRREGGSAFLAGVMLGLAGLARTEMVLFLTAAGVLAAVWARRRVVTFALVAGFALIAALTAVTVTGSPSHHLAYLANDAVMHVLAFRQPIAVLRSNGRLLTEAGALVGAVVLAAGFVGRRCGVGFFQGMARALVLLAVVASVFISVELGDRPRPLRQLGWLAAYCSWELLALAAAGGVAAWRRGGPAARFAVLYWLLVAAIFIANPRVTVYQPWAIRRFLPVVIPGLMIAAAAALALIAAGRGRARTLTALTAALAVALLEVRPILAVGRQPFFAGSFEATRALADRVPSDAIVVIDGAFAGVQIQVPLWLVHGRETVMVGGHGTNWRRVMTALVASGRPVYWIANRYSQAPTVPGLVFRVVAPDHEIRVPLPVAPADEPPARTVIRLVPLRIYRVAAGAGLAPAAGLVSTAGAGVALSSAGSIPLYCAYSSSVNSMMPSWKFASSPPASRARTMTQFRPSLVKVCVTTSPVSVGEPSPKSQVKL